MKFILFIYLKTTSMKMNWKQVALYILRILELVITGAAGGAITQLSHFSFARELPLIDRGFTQELFCSIDG